MEQTINATYQLLMADPDLASDARISKALGPILVAFLAETYRRNYLDIVKFYPSWAVAKRRLQRISRAELTRLRDILPSATIISDLNSAVMGIPALADSDLDFTIPVANQTHQDELVKLLEAAGYTLDKAYDDESPVKWLSYHRFTKSGVEIEVKLRYYQRVKKVLIAHRNIASLLSPRQKLTIGYIKSHTTGKTYKKFKYLIYGAMFCGHKDSIIFRLG